MDLIFLACAVFYYSISHLVLKQSGQDIFRNVNIGMKISNLVSGEMGMHSFYWNRDIIRDNLIWI